MPIDTVWLLWGTGSGPLIQGVYLHEHHARADAEYLGPRYYVEEWSVDESTVAVTYD